MHCGSVACRSTLLYCTAASHSDRATAHNDGSDHTACAACSSRPFAFLLPRYNITTFPTLLWFSRYDKRGQPFSGGSASLPDLLSFINDKAGTHRSLLAQPKEKAAGARQRRDTR